VPRVVSGKSRGIILDTPKGLKTRPTADKVKEAVFNIIANQLIGARFLDAFAGSGQIGIEALSRGAESAVFFDQDKECIRYITGNLKKTKLDGNAKVITGEARNGISRLEPGVTFDIVYIDPPYDCAISMFRQIASLLFQHNRLASPAIVILEHRSSDVPDAIVMNLQLKRSCKYGTVMISFYDRMY